MKKKLEPIKNRIDVWSLYLPDCAGERAACGDLLTPAERGRAARFHRPADADGFVLARGLLRRILSNYLDCPPAEIRFTRNGNGKPFLENHPLEFNLSHSRERVLIAVTADRRVGIDIEFRRKTLRMEAIAARWFAPEEQAFFQSLPALSDEGVEGENPYSGFFDIWSKKEAYVKALGVSIYKDLNTFAVPTGGIPGEQAIGADGKWFFQTLEIAPDYAAALVSEAPPVPVCLRGLAG
jgi:4'-phosphopantetheinyl transferase